MSKEIKISKPITLETKHSEVYEFSPQGKASEQVGIKAKSLLFLKRDKNKDAWKTAEQRDRLFSTIWTAESKSLKSRTVVEIEASAESYKYSYHENGKLISKTLPLQQPAPSEASALSNDNQSAGIEKPTFYKVQELSLRQFKQVQLANAFIELLKALIDLLATPFAYLYQLIAGRGEPRHFASMLVPVEHDRVGEINHEAVLSQLQFMGRLFAEEDPEDHNKMQPLELVKEQKITLDNGRTYPCIEEGNFYKIWVDGDRRIDPSSNSFSPKTQWIKQNEAWFEYKDEDLNKPEFEDVKYDKNKPRRKTDPLYSEHPWHFRERMPSGKKGYSNLKFYNQWALLPKDHPLVDPKRPRAKKNIPSTTPLTKDREAEKKRELEQPWIFSGAQEASRVFDEAYAYGKEMYEAHNSGSKKRADKIIATLSAKLENLSHENHLVLPLAQGEGKNYVPNFLVFTHEIDEKKVAHHYLKHISFSSTTLDKGKMQVVTTYDIASTLKNPESCARFVRSLFAMQSYSRAKDKEESKLKGPKVRDTSLESLLLHFGKIVPSTEGPVERKSSRDPIKAIFTVVQEMKIKEDPHLGGPDPVLKNLTASKSRFYTVYVNHLISYYEQNESRLTAKEREHALDGILWYANQLRHYVENEVNTDTALAVSENLIEFVEKKLSELKRTEALENEDIQNLKNKANLFRGKLADSVSASMQLRVPTKEVEGYRLTPTEWAIVKTLQDMAYQSDFTIRENRTAFYTAYLDGSRGVYRYLQAKNPLAAKTLLIGLMQALPAVDDGSQNKTFWDHLDEAEITVWSKELSNTAEKMMEASLRSGTFPLKPHEVFEFNIMLPMIQRYLLMRKIPSKVDTVEGLLKTYNTNPNRQQTIGQLQQTLGHFTKLREDEIVLEVTKELKKIWKREDDDEKKQQKTYDTECSKYKRQLAQYEKDIKDPQKRNWAHRPSEPVKPHIKPKQQKEAERKVQLENTITDRKQNDPFLTELKAIDRNGVASLGTNWDRLILSSCNRTQAVMGQFARIIGISKADYAYKLAKEDWVGSTFESCERAIWLMEKDYSLLVGTSPFFEQRFAACKRVFRDCLAKKPKHIDERLACNFIIGYDQLGDGTRLKDQQKQELQQKISAHFKGYFNEGQGGNLLAPEEISSIRKLDFMRKILRDPADYLTHYYPPGLKGRAMRMILKAPLNNAALRKKFAAMEEIHLVAALSETLIGSGIGSEALLKGNLFGCFTVSSNQSTGSIASNEVKEKPATHQERQNYMGQITPRMIAERAGADHERDKVDEVSSENLYTGLSPEIEFVLRLSSLTKSKYSSQKRFGDSRREQELSYLAISQCMHFIYQYPELLEIPKVQHTLYKTFFQQGLIKNQLKRNPEFFIRFGKVLNEICSFLEKKGEEHQVSVLFIREVCEKIRQQAFSLDVLRTKASEDEKSIAEKISEALPVYDFKNVVGLFDKNINSDEQKVFATFALSYFCNKIDDNKINENKVDDNNHKVPPGCNNNEQDIGDWNTLLTAYYIMQKSPREMGHSGLQAELVYKVQKNFFPVIALALEKGNPAFRDALLNKLSGKQGTWQVNPQKKPYSYLMPINEGFFEIDLRTGKGFLEGLIKLGKRCKLPEQIRTDANFKFLFQEADPIVEAVAGENGIIKYHWKDEKSGCEFEFLYRQQPVCSVQINQITNGQKYLFQKLALNESKLNKAWLIYSGQNNNTIENLIKAKGVWIPVDKNGNKSTPNAVLAQHGWNLEKDPITLIINKSTIAGATMGKGKDKKWICSSLANRESKLLSCRSGDGLLLLSKDKSHVDEIRFPPDPITKEQLILKKKDDQSDIWVASGREDWVWQLNNTRTYEQRFGEDWREYILPLKNQKTGEEEIWIFSHNAAGSGKRGGKVTFIKTLVDYAEVVGTTLNSSGMMDIDMDELRMWAGAAQSVRADEMIDLLDGSGANDDNAHGNSSENESAEDKFANLAKAIKSPQGIRYRIDHRAESSSHAGFLYLAYVASLRGDWGTANRYLQLMVENGYSTASDLKQLQEIIYDKYLTFIMKAMMEAMMEQRSASISLSVSETAFRAKLFANLISLNTRLSAQLGEEIFVDHLKLFPNVNAKQVFLGAAQLAFQEYRKSLPTHHQQLEDHGLLLTKREEAILTADFVMQAAVSSMSQNNNLPTQLNPPLAPEPYQLAVPGARDMDELVEAMADYIQPNGVWSIHDLHKEKGSYPKWETVLANFWCYWEWIYQNDLQVEDIAFLLRKAPPLGKSAKPTEVRKHNAIDTACRTLLLFWHYCKQQRYQAHRKEHLRSEEALLREVKLNRLDMLDLAGMETKRQQIRHKAALEPGLIGPLYAKGYAIYVEIMRQLAKLTVKENVGGISQERGIRKDFADASKDLLMKFLADATQNDYQNGFVIHPNEINPPKKYIPPKEAKKVDRLDALKEKAWSDLMGQNFLLGMLGVMLGSSSLDKMKPIFKMALDLPDFDEAWAKLASYPDFSSFLNGVPLLKDQAKKIHAQYMEAAGFPKSPYPRNIEDGKYERIEVKEKTDPNWKQYFVDSLPIWNIKTGEWEKKESVWESKKKLAKEYFDISVNSENSPEKHKIEKIRAGIDVATEDLKKRTGSSFNITAINRVYNTLTKDITELRQQNKNLRGEILNFARNHADQLGLMFLFADPGRITEEQIFQKVYDLYRYGQLGRLEDDKLQEHFASLITEQILVATEMQQYEKAQKTCKDLAAIWQQIQQKIPASYEGEKRINIAQSLANRSVDWLLYSADLKRFLEEGADRQRYTDLIDGKRYLNDQSYTRRYLTSDVRNRWISRKKAIAALEDMLKDISDSEVKGKPVRFIIAKMGTGKSDFIFPEAIDLLLQKHYEPVMITTDDLVDQLKISMGHKAFIFKFSIDFGLDKVHENELNKLSPDEKQKKLDEYLVPELIEAHLRNLLHSLENLKAEGKAVLTSPSQLAALRDKREQLRGTLNMLSKEKRTIVFRQLELIKKIEAQFKKEKTIRLIDEDTNYDISMEFNFATGDFRTVEPVRFDVAERMMKKTQEKFEGLWKLIVENNLRAVQDISKEFREVARSMFQDIEFWKSVGWKEEVWKQIDEEEFIEYVLGKNKNENLPKGMPEWDFKKKDEDQQEKWYVAALKTYLSQTLDAVCGVNPKLERGISGVNGVTVVPCSDGKAKEGVLYGEESENIFHHIFHYAGATNKLGEEIFIQNFKELKNLHVRISPFSEDTWNDWGNRIAEILKNNRYSEDTDKGYKSEYEAFINAPELAFERIQFLRHLMLDTKFIRVYHEQITFNSQDLGIPGCDIRMASGTGQAFALNLSDYTDEVTNSPDVVLGETLLCLDLNRETKTFKKLDPVTNTYVECTPLEHIEQKAQDKRCHAILNYDYEVLGNNSELLAARLRTKVERQMVYRVQEEQQLVKKIWNAGEHFFPMTYESEALDKDMFAIFSRSDTRGVQIHMHRGGNKYAEAMVGTGNKEDAIAQTLWRMRHLDMGHDIEMSHDKKTENQIRKACGLTDPNQPVKIGHAMKYFTLNTLEDDSVKNVKAVIFKAATPLKTYIDEVVSAPYDLTDIENTSCLEEIEGKVINNATRNLYVMCNRSRWAKEYQAQKKMKPLEFMEHLLRSELEKIQGTKDRKNKGMEEIFHLEMREAVKQNKSIVNLVGLLDQADILIADKKDLELWMASNLILGVNAAKKDKEDVAIAREIMRKYYAIRVGFKKAVIDLENEQKKLATDTEYQKYLEKNLPALIAGDLSEGSRNEQKVQQLQEQKQEQKQQKTERVLHIGGDNSETTPINYQRFKEVVCGRKNIEIEKISDYYSYKYTCRWEKNGYFLPLKTAMKQELGITLPDDLYKNIYISQRAWKLLQKMGHAGAPAVDLLVVEDNNGTHHSVIITPPEREETVANALIEEREIAKKTSDSNVNYPAPYTLEQAWIDIKEALLKVQVKNTDPKMIQTFLSENEGKIKYNLGQYLKLEDNLASAGTTVYLEQMLSDTYDITYEYKNEALKSKELKQKLMDIHLQYNKLKRQNIYIDPNNINHIAVYALSNEHFSPMIMDAVKDLEKENGNDFIHLMVMNKLYLNWIQYSLKELDYLIDYVLRLSQNDFTNQLERNIHKIHGKTEEIKIITETETKYKELPTKTADLVRQIRERNKEWFRKLAMRKLDENYYNAQRQPRPEEMEAIKEWLKSMKNIELTQQMRRLQTLNANYSANLINETYHSIKSKK